MKSTLKFLALLVAAFAAVTFARATDIDGKWKAEFDTQIGVQKYVYELKLDGDKLTGKATFERGDQKGSVDLTEGKVAKDEVTFVEPLKFQDQEIRVVYKGKLAGDEIKFTRAVGDFATEELVAKRVVDKK
jgi:hypothetical protein